MSTEQIILKLQSVRASTKSEANKQLLTECLDELREMRQAETQQQLNASQFYVRQRLKLNPDAFAKLGVDMTPEGFSMRFLVNRIDDENHRLWVVDEKGIEKPMWIDMSDVMPADE